MIAYSSHTIFALVVAYLCTIEQATHLQGQADDTKQVLEVAQRFAQYLQDQEREELAKLFVNNGDACLADGTTILKGDKLHRLATREFENAGLRRSIFIVIFLAQDAALVLQRATAQDGTPQQESLLLVKSSDGWQIQHYHATKRATWAAGVVANLDSKPSQQHQPEVLKPDGLDFAVGDVSADQRREITNAIEVLLNHHEEAYNKPDADLYAECFGPNGALLPAGGQAILVGRENIRKTVSNAIAGFRGIEVSLEAEDLKILGPGLATARVIGSVKRDDGSEHEFVGFKVGLWYRIFVRQPNGSWLYALQHNTPPVESR